jgi:hypothetical protein
VIGVAYDCKAVMDSFHGKPYVTRLGWAWLDARGRLNHEVWKGKASLFPALKSGQVQIACFKGAGSWRIAKRSLVVAALRQTTLRTPPSATSCIDRLERHCAEWQERIEAATHAKKTHPENAEICFHADLFINQAGSILDNLGEGEPQEWCLPDGPRPTSGDIDMLCCNLASTAFSAGRHWQEMHDEMENEGWRAVEAQQTRGAPKRPEAAYLRRIAAQLRDTHPRPQFKDFLDAMEGGQSPHDSTFRILVDGANEKVWFGPDKGMTFASLRTNYWSRKQSV